MLAIGKRIIHYALAVMLVSMLVWSISADKLYGLDDVEHSLIISDYSHNRDEMLIKGQCQGDDASQCCCIIDIPSIVQSKSAVLDDRLVPRFVRYYPVKFAVRVSTPLLRPPITRI